MGVLVNVEWGNIMQVVNNSFPIVALVGLMAIDLLTGIIKAAKKKELSSTLCKQGILQKSSILLLVLAGSLFQPFFQAATFGQDAVRLSDLLAGGFGVSEFLSIGENVKEINGGKLPLGVDRFFNDLKTSPQRIFTKVGEPAQAVIVVTPVVAPVPTSPAPNPTETKTDEPAPGGGA